LNSLRSYQIITIFENRNDIIFEYSNISAYKML
jgi:hypothetical protein